MSNARDCLIQAGESGRIPTGRVRELTDMLGAFEQEFQATLGPHAAARQAELVLAAKVARDAARKRDLVARQLITQARVKAVMAAHPDGAAAGGRSLLTMDLKTPRTVSIEKQTQVIEGEIHQRLAAGLKRFRPTLAGGHRDKAGQANVVRALFGEKTDDRAAHEIATAVGEVGEWLRVRANAAGAEIPRRLDYHLPNPRWDARRINEGGYQAFRDGLWERLDRRKMIDHDTGAPMSDLTLETILRDAYDTLRTDGLNKIKPGAMPTNRRMKARTWDEHHRVLVFRDADSWLAVQERFGRGEAWEVITGHHEKMANDIAWLEVMGPNPEATRRFIHDTASRDAAMIEGPKARAAIDKTATTLKRMDDEWDEMSGLLSTPTSHWMASVGSGARTYLAAVLLGRAFLSSISDFATMQLTAHMNGLSQRAMLGHYLRLWASPVAREEARQAGLLAEGYAKAVSQQVRYTGQLLADGFTSRLANFTMTASLLKPHTEFAQWAFQMEFLGAIARVADRGWDDLSPRLRGALERYGLSGDDWPVVAKAVKTDRGVRKLSVIDMARIDHPRAVEAAATIHRMVLSERDMAVIVPNARTRSTGLFGGSQGTRAGTVLGEVVRSLGMFKSFPITLISNHITRAALQTGLGGKLAYGGAFFGLSGLYGMIALQSKQVTMGKDPMPMDRWETWGAAFMQGGGLGIWGDFLFRAENRFGQGIAVTLAGPLVGALSETKKATWDNALAMLAGEETHFGRDALQLFGRYGFAPGNLWYTRLPFERAVLDQLSIMVDPEAHRSFARKVRQAQKDNDQGFWWAPGKTAPRRAPAPPALPMGIGK